MYMREWSFVKKMERVPWVAVVVAGAGFGIVFGVALANSGISFMPVRVDDTQMPAIRLLTSAAKYVQSVASSVMQAPTPMWR